MKNKEIILNGKKYPYQIQEKNIKRCYIKVIQGQLMVTTSPRFSQKEIEQCIQENKDKIIERLEAYQPKYSYTDNGYVDIFGVRYRIVQRDMKQRKCSIHGNTIYVYHQNITAVIEEYLKSIVYIYIEKRIMAYLENDFTLSMPSIEVRKYKSRWGACFSTKQKVSFNVALAHLDTDLIDYVIVHELCHFMQPNHSKQFYLEVFKRMPDYKVRQGQLKEIGI